jgi:hypothetical protein
MRLIYPPVGKAQQKRKQAGLLDTAPQRPVQRRQAEVGDVVSFKRWPSSEPVPGKIVRVDELAIYLDLGPGQFVQFVARDSWRVPMYLWEQNDPSAWVSVW